MYEWRAGLPLAGCYGDFDGDGRRDCALLLASPAGDKVLPHVFLAREETHRMFALNPVTDPYGFNEDRFLWPGPFCLKKPETGLFEAFDQATAVVGDVIQVGWHGYVWRPDAERFDTLQVLD